MSAEPSIKSLCGWLSLAAIVLLILVAAQLIREPSDSPPIAKATRIGGKPARYDDKAKAWVLTDEKDLTVEEEQ